MECKICGNDMVVKENRTTKQKFWGCPMYPDCKGMAPMKQAQVTPLPQQELKTTNTIPTPKVEKVLNDKKVSRDGSYVTTGQILELAVKLWTSEQKAIPGNFNDVVTDVMEEFKRVREEFR